MIPILYDKNATDFDNNGIGHLKDTISFKVKEGRNSHPELTMQYPISGIWYDQISEGSIIKGKTNETSALQLFRIEKSSKPLKGIVTFYGKHISCDLCGIPLQSLSMESVTPGVALSTGFANALIPHRFTAWSDITTINNINIKKPRSLRDLCGGEDGSVLDIWGGEFEFDNFEVKLHRSRGVNNGVVINYGKNLTDAKQERNIRFCYTHFYPYAIKQTETRNDAGEVIESHEELITLAEGPIELLNPKTIGHSKTLTLDISDMFADGEEINEANLRMHTEKYIATHNLGVPEVNITLSFAHLWESPEYSNIAFVECVALCDTVTVRFLDLGIDVQAKIVNTEYDGLEECFTKIEVGDLKSNFADTINGMQNAAKQSEAKLNGAIKSIARMEANTSVLESRIEIITEWIGDEDSGAVASIAHIGVLANENQAKISTLTNRVTDTEESIGYLEIDVEDHASQLEAIAKWQSDTENSIAEIDETANANQASIKAITSWQGSTDQSIASIKQNVNAQSTAITAEVERAKKAEEVLSSDIAKVQISSNDNSTNITLLTERIKETELSIGYIELDVRDHTSQLEALTKWQDDTDISIASIESEASDNTAKINLLVETSESGENTVRGSVLVEAINGQSTATISADKVNLAGYVTITSIGKIGEDGATIIDGNRIQTGQIISQDFLDDDITIVFGYMDVTETIDNFAGDLYSYEFSGSDVAFFLGEEYRYKSYTFTLSKEFSYGTISLKKDGTVIVTHNDGTRETTGIEQGDGRIVFSIDPMSLLTNKGTLIDLETGDLRSDSFAVVGNRSYFSGTINTEQKAKIASWDIGDSIKTTLISETDSAQSTWNAELTYQSLRLDFVSDTVSGQHVEGYVDYGISGFTHHVKEPYQEYSCSFYYGGMILEDSLGVYKSDDGSYSVGVDFITITNNMSGKTYRIAVDEETMTVKAILDA